MTLRVSVDLDRCQGHGKCMLACPEVFSEDIQGYPQVTVTEVGAELQASVRHSAEDCPERAITISS